MSGLKEIKEIILADIKEVVRDNKEKVEEAYKRVMRLAHWHIGKGCWHWSECVT